MWISVGILELHWNSVFDFSTMISSYGPGHRPCENDSRHARNHLGGLPKAVSTLPSTPPTIHHCKFVVFRRWPLGRKTLAFSFRQPGRPEWKTAQLPIFIYLGAYGT